MDEGKMYGKYIVVLFVLDLDWSIEEYFYLFKWCKRMFLNFVDNFSRFFLNYFVVLGCVLKNFFFV